MEYIIIIPVLLAINYLLVKKPAKNFLRMEVVGYLLVGGLVRFAHLLNIL